MVQTEVLEKNNPSSCKRMKDIKSLKPDLKSELTNHYVRHSKSNTELFIEQTKLF